MASTSRFLTCPTTSVQKYDVFLSFRGPDVRYSFADCLYEFLDTAGFHVFMDDEQLRVGESIARGIQDAINDSKLLIPIFSRGYASSKWCLMEIAWMVDCVEKFPEKEILPVFYDVNASDVKLKTEMYTEALREHEKNFGHETVERWRNALVKVPKVKGWNLKDFDGQGKLIKRISEHISREIELKRRNLPGHLIGIQDQIQDILKFLDCGTYDVRVVVIHGMGGIGKTTLSGIIFNRICQQFHRCIFLPNIRETAEGKGIVNLQSKLTQDTVKFPDSNLYDPNDGENCIKRSLRNKNVLIALDDVDDEEHIAKLIGMGNWLGPGSRAIITTRNLSCVADLKESLQGDKIYMHEMRELNFDDSLQLFSLHAFSQRVPPYGYRELSLDILSFTRGIPLALEVIGSNLKWKSLAIWKEMLRKLKKVPHERLYREILMSSYETLSDEAKEVFLDIVFFFSCHDKTTALHYWEACDLFPVISIDTLVSYALVKINYRNEFWMHDLLIDLGREVVRKQGREKLGTRSRLCNEDAERLLLKRQGTEEVKALKLKSVHAHDFTPFDLSRLSGLRFLKLCRGNFVGEFDGCLSELRWLSWSNCPLDFKGKYFDLGNLVVLKLSWSNIADAWAGWEQFETATNLKVLELKGLDIARIPGLDSFLSLERLVVNDCWNFVRIDPSIGNLQCLDSLEITRRYHHRKSPEDTGSYQSCDVALRLPGSICKLTSMTRLVIEGFKMEELPEDMGDLKSLKTLKLVGCHSLQNLPDSIGNLESLSELCLRGDGITELPKSVGNLKNLTLLDVSFNCLRRLPATIGALERLEDLDASHNGDLQGGIPGEFGMLLSLKSLDLSWTDIAGLPSSIVGMSHLKSLDLSECHEIQELPELPTSLTKLRISSRSLKTVPDLSRQTNLVILSLSNRENYIDEHPGEVLTGSITAWIHRLQELESLVVDLSPMSPSSTELAPLFRLKHLAVSWTDPSCLSLPSGLVSLQLYDSMSLPRWKCLSHLDCLSQLTLHGSTATEIRLDGLELLKNLTHLVIAICKFLERVHDISKLKKLLYLSFYCCPNLEDIGGLAQLHESLQLLWIQNCHSIGSLPAKSDTGSPSELFLHIENCYKLGDFQGPYDRYLQEKKSKINPP